MNKYPLQSFLRILKRREDDAQQAVIQARKRVAAATSALAERKRELAEYQEWCSRETERIFADVLGKAVPHQKILDARSQIAWNESQIPLYEGKVQEAKAALIEEEKLLAACIQKQQAASKEVYKIENHRDMWETQNSWEMEVAEEALNEESAEVTFSYKSRA